MQLIFTHKEALALARIFGAAGVFVASVVAASTVSPAQRAVLDRYVAAPNPIRDMPGLLSTGVARSSLLPSGTDNGAQPCAINDEGDGRDTADRRACDTGE